MENSQPSQHCDLPKNLAFKFIWCSALMPCSATALCILNVYPVLLTLYCILLQCSYLVGIAVCDDYTSS